MKLYRLLEDGDGMMIDDLRVRSLIGDALLLFRPYTPESQEVNKELVELCEEVVNHLAAEGIDELSFRIRFNNLKIKMKSELVSRDKTGEILQPFKWEMDRKYKLRGGGWGLIRSLEGGAIRGETEGGECIWYSNGNRSCFSENKLDLLPELYEEPKAEEPKQELRWISTSERMPTKEDACSLERVKCRCSLNGQEFEAYYNWNNVPSIPHIKIIAFLPLSSLPPYTKKEEVLPDLEDWLANQDGEPSTRDLWTFGVWHAKKGMEYAELLRKQNEGKE